MTQAHTALNIYNNILTGARAASEQYSIAIQDNTSVAIYANIVQGGADGASWRGIYLFSSGIATSGNNIYGNRVINDQTPLAFGIQIGENTSGAGDGFVDDNIVYNNRIVGYTMAVQGMVCFMGFQRALLS